MRVRALLASTIVIGSLWAASTAGATEPASWLSFGTGYERGKAHARVTSSDALLLAGQVGIGSSLENPFVIGVVGGVRLDLGVDAQLSLAVRGATRGYMLGEWGAAIDIGVASHVGYPSAFGHFPFDTSFTLGVPWGPILQLGVELSDVTGQSPSASGLYVIAGIDIVRVVAARAHGTASFFPDPPPPPARENVRVE